MIPALYNDALMELSIRIAWSAIEADAPATPEADAFRSYFCTTWLDGNFLPRT